MGSTVLSAVDIPMSRAYTEARRSGKVGGGKRRTNKVGSDSTVRRELVVLVAAANHALRWKRIKPADMPSIELPRETVASVDEDDEALLPGAPFFTREQVDKLIALAGQETADPLREMQRWIRVVYFTGARRRSIENLTVRQVVLDRRKINLATPGKRQTKKRQPVVPIFTVIEDDLKVLCEGKKPTDRVFKPRNFYRDFMALCRALEFPEPHHPHMLRHSRATHLLQDRRSPYDVAKLLGDTLKTVEANYGHHAPDDLRSALE